jgi:hypothetical protein
LRHYVGGNKQRNGVSVANVHGTVKKIGFRLIGLIAYRAPLGHVRKMGQIVRIGVRKEIPFVATGTFHAHYTEKLGSFGKRHGYLFRNSMQR